MITPRKKLEEYRKLLQQRYENLCLLLMGREADYNKPEDRRAPRGRSYTKEWVDQCNISDPLQVRMAVDDFQTILKEIKKLAAK